MAVSRSSRALTLGLVAFTLTLAGTAQPANALVRAGVDAIWVPLSADRVESRGQVLDSTHRASSFGVSAHANLGFNILSVGLKANYFNEGMKLEDLQNPGDANVRRTQLDVNLMGRIAVPATKLAAIGEGGVSFSPDGDGVGFNIGLGAEYRIAKVSLLEGYVGLEGQYVNFPADLNGLPTDNRSGRLLVYLGVDFGP